MLGCYYDIALKDEFEPLFQDTYIYHHPTNEKNSYFILRFDFSGLNSNDIDLLEQEIANRVYDNCIHFLHKYHIDLELEKRSAAGTLSQLLSLIQTVPLYVIIDEYTQCAGWCDHFANELLSFRFDEFDHIVSENGYVRKFYTLRTHGVKYCAKGALGENWYCEWHNW